MTAGKTNHRVPVPRDPTDDYSRQAAQLRLEFARRHSGAAQVPIGLAGPLRVNGEHARGDFYVPLATAEGTLVASYNRGMKLLYAAGGGPPPGVGCTQGGGGAPALLPPPAAWAG